MLQLSALSDRMLDNMLDRMLDTMLVSYGSTLSSLVFMSFPSSGHFDVEASMTGYAIHV